MRTAAALLVLAASASSIGAFVLPRGLTDLTRQRPPATIKIAAEASTGSSRRESVQKALGWAALMMPFVVGSSTQVLAAEQKYLKEPTPEFLEAQSKIEAFERAQLAKKQEWTKRFASLDKASTEKELVAVLDSLTQWVLQERGLPVGIKKQSLITEIRKTKRKGKETNIWNKEAEIAYEDLIQSVSYMISPNTERNRSNPL